MVSILQPAVETLVERRLVEDRIRGTPAAEVEGAAVLEAAALALWSNPRIVYLLWLLARNGLLSAITEELAALAALLEAVVSANRPSYAIRDLRQLEQARLALLQIEGQGNLNTGSGTFQSFTKAIDTFLGKSLAPSVRVRGASSLQMSGTEAVTQIPGLYETVVGLHTEVTDRASKLAVCIPNFLQSDVGTYSGVTTAVRARIALEQVMEALKEDPTPTSPQDLTLSLLAMKASLKSMGERPDPSEKISASAQLPSGRVLRLRSEEVLASVWLGEPINLTGGGASLSVGGQTWSMPSFPLAGYDLANRACIVTDPITFPVTIPSGSFLFLVVGGVTVPIPLFAGSTTLAALLAQLVAPGIHAEELYPGSDRIAIVADSNGYNYIGVATSYVSLSGSVSESTVHTLLGLSSLPWAESGSTDPRLVRDVLLWMTSSGVDVLLEDSGLKIQALGYSPTSALTFAINTYSGTSTAVTDTVWLEENGEAVSPVGLVDVGDYFEHDGATYTVTAVGDYLTVTPYLSGLDRPAEISSGLVREVAALEDGLVTATQVFAREGWLSGVALLDSAVARVLGQPNTGSINSCAQVIDTLVGSLQALHSSIAAQPVAQAPNERAAASRLLTALRERGFDRAHDFLLRGAVREIFSMDWQTASYAGEILAAAAAVGTSDIKWPNRAKDEGFEAASVDEG